MKGYPRIIKHVPSLLAVILIAGCSYMPGMDKVIADRKVEYKKSRQAEQNLEIPPDLSRSSINDTLVIPGAPRSDPTTLSGFEGREQVRGRVAARAAVLPAVSGIKVVRDGDEQWLRIDSPPEDVWFRVVEFWQENGILLQEQDPAVGVIVTDWLEERPNIDTGVISGLLNKAIEGLHSASTRDQYRVRLEPGERPDTTELYLTHRGMQEMIIQDGAGTVERTVWNPRPSDPGLEAEILRRLMIYLGVSEQRAGSALAAKDGGKAKPRSTLNRIEGKVSLTVDEGFDRAWRLVGVALDRVGFAVEDRNRAGGVYYVRYNDPMKDAEDEGWLSKLAFWQKDDDNFDKDNQYQVKLNDAGKPTEVVVLNDKGERVNSETALRILTLLNEQIR